MAQPSAGPASLPGDQPSGEVTLRREVPPEEVPVDGIDMSFYMKKAFTVHWPWASLAGSLFCLASLDVWRQISTKYMLIHVSCAWAWGLGGQGMGSDVSFRDLRFGFCGLWNSIQPTSFQQHPM